MVDVSKILPENLDTNKEYVVRVRSINGLGNPSEWSEGMYIDTSKINTGEGYVTQTDKDFTILNDQGEVVFGSYSVQAQRFNLIKNPSFETNTTGWSALSNSSISQVSSEAFYGTYAVKVTPTVTGTEGIGLTLDAADLISVDQDDIYTVSCYVYREYINLEHVDDEELSDSSTVNLIVNYYDNADGLLGSVINSQSIQIPNNSWTRVFIEDIRIPSGVAKVGLTLKYDDSETTAITTGEGLYADAFMVEKDGEVNGYFDGSTIEGTTQWAGTPHNSVSEFENSTSSTIFIKGALTVGGVLESTNYDGPDGGEIYADDGTQINLGDGSIISKNFVIDAVGNVYIKEGITIGGYIPEGGAADDVNSGVTTISGGKITSGTITGQEISATTTISVGDDTGGNDIIEIVGGATPPDTYIHSSGTSYGTGDGFYMDASGRFSLGTALTYDDGVLTIGGAPGGTEFIPVGGAAADINANVTTISGGKIETGTLHADRIEVGTIVADQIQVGGLDDSAIFGSGVITADHLSSDANTSVNYDEPDGGETFADLGAFFNLSTGNFISKSIVMDNITGTVEIANLVVQDLSPSGNLRLQPDQDVSLGSINHPFQIGADNLLNLAMDENEIQGRFNYAASALYLNASGGKVIVGIDGVESTGPLVGERIATTSTVAVAPGETDHGLTIGLTTGEHLAADANTIQAFTDATPSLLQLNQYGGDVIIGGETTVQDNLILLVAPTLDGHAVNKEYADGLAGTAIADHVAELDPHEQYVLNDGDTMTGLLTAQAGVSVIQGSDAELLIKSNQSTDEIAFAMTGTGASRFIIFPSPSGVPDYTDEFGYDFSQDRWFVEKDFQIGDDLRVTGDLTVNGTTTTVNSETVTIDDPIFTLGGDTAPVLDDNKDRGIEFRWHNGTIAKLGFFGFDDSTGKMTFIPDATNSSEVFSGAIGEIDAQLDFSNLLNWQTGLDARYVEVAGDTMTGDLTLFKSNPHFILRPSAGVSGVYFRTIDNDTSWWMAHDESHILAFNSYTHAGAFSGARLRLVSEADGSAHIEMHQASEVMLPNLVTHRSLTTASANAYYEVDSNDIAQFQANSTGQFIFQGTTGVVGNLETKWEITSTGLVAFRESVFFDSPVQLDSGPDITLATEGHPLTIGLITGANLAFDDNEIQSRVNGTYANLSINALGGNVVLGAAANADTLVQGDLVVANNGGSLFLGADSSLNEYNSTYPNPVIAALTGGTTSGLLLQGPGFGHVVVALDANDTGDQFLITSNAGSYVPGNDQDTQLFRVRANGLVEVMEGDLAMTSGGRITGVGDATADGDAISRLFADNRFVNIDGDEMIGDLSIGSSFDQSGNSGVSLAADGSLIRLNVQNTNSATLLLSETSATVNGGFFRYDGDDPSGNLIQIGSIQSNTEFIAMQFDRGSANVDFQGIASAKGLTTTLDNSSQMFRMRNAAVQSGDAAVHGLRVQTNADNNVIFFVPEDQLVPQYSKELGFSFITGQWFVEGPLQIGEPVNETDAATKLFVTDQVLTANNAITNHVGESTGAHAASAISILDPGIVPAWFDTGVGANLDVQTALNVIVGQVNAPSDELIEDLIDSMNTYAGGTTISQTGAGSIFSADAISAQIIAANTILGSNIQAGTITSANIASQTITGDLISASIAMRIGTNGQIVLQGTDNPLTTSISARGTNPVRAYDEWIERVQPTALLSFDGNFTDRSSATASRVDGPGVWFPGESDSRLEIPWSTYTDFEIIWRGTIGDPSQTEYPIGRFVNNGFGIYQAAGTVLNVLVKDGAGSNIGIGTSITEAEVPWVNRDGTYWFRVARSGSTWTLSISPSEDRPPTTWRHSESIIGPTDSTSGITDLYVGYGGNPFKGFVSEVIIRDDLDGNVVTHFRAEDNLIDRTATTITPNVGSDITVARNADTTFRAQTALVPAGTFTYVDETTYGVISAWDVNDFVDIAIPNVPFPRRGLASHFITDGVQTIDAADESNAVAFVLSIDESYTNTVPTALYASGGGTHGQTIALEGFTLVAVRAQGGLTRSRLEYALPGPGTYTVGVRCDPLIGGEFTLYINGNPVQSQTNTVNTSNGTSASRFGTALSTSRYDVVGGALTWGDITTDNMTGTGLAIAEFVFVDATQDSNWFADYHNALFQGFGTGDGFHIDASGRLSVGTSLSWDGNRYLDIGDGFRWDDSLGKLTIGSAANTNPLEDFGALWEARLGDSSGIPNSGADDNVLGLTNTGLIRIEAPTIWFPYAGTGDPIALARLTNATIPYDSNANSYIEYTLDQMENTGSSEGSVFGNRSGNSCGLWVRHDPTTGVIVTRGNGTSLVQPSNLTAMPPEFFTGTTHWRVEAPLVGTPRAWYSLDRVTWIEHGAGNWNASFTADTWVNPSASWSIGSGGHNGVDRPLRGGLKALRISQDGETVFELNPSDIASTNPGATTVVPSIGAPLSVVHEGDTRTTLSIIPSGAAFVNPDPDTDANELTNDVNTAYNIPASEDFIFFVAGSRQYSSNTIDKWASIGYENAGGYDGIRIFGRSDFDIVQSQVSDFDTILAPGENGDYTYNDSRVTGVVLNRATDEFYMFQVSADGTFWKDDPTDASTIGAIANTVSGATFLRRTAGTFIAGGFLAGVGVAPSDAKLREIAAHILTPPRLASGSSIESTDFFKASDSHFSNLGSRWDLTTGEIITPQLAISATDGSARFAGELIAPSGDIGGWTISGETLSSADMILDAGAGEIEINNTGRILVGDDANQIILNATATDTTTYIGANASDYNQTGAGMYADASGRFSLGDKLTWNGIDTLTIDGEIAATTGTIGGWDIGTTDLSSTNDRIFLDSAGDGEIRVGPAGGNVIEITGSGTTTSAAIHTSTATAFETGTGFWMDAAGRVFFGDGLGEYISFDGANIDVSTLNFSIDSATGDVELTGTITAGAGNIAGWDIEPLTLEAPNDSVVLDSRGVIKVGNAYGSQVTLDSSAGTNSSAFAKLSQFDGLWMASEGDAAGVPNLGTEGGTLDMTVVGDMDRVEGPAIWFPGEATTQNNRVASTVAYVGTGTETLYELIVRGEIAPYADQVAVSGPRLITGGAILDLNASDQFRARVRTSADVWQPTPYVDPPHAGPVTWSLGFDATTGTVFLGYYDDANVYVELTSAVYAANTLDPGYGYGINSGQGNYTPRSTIYSIEERIDSVVARKMTPEQIANSAPNTTAIGDFGVFRDTTGPVTTVVQRGGEYINPDTTTAADRMSVASNAAFDLLGTEDVTLIRVGRLGTHFGGSALGMLMSVGSHAGSQPGIRMWTRADNYTTISYQVNSDTSGNRQGSLSIPDDDGLRNQLSVQIVQYDRALGKAFAYSYFEDGTVLTDLGETLDGTDLTASAIGMEFGYLNESTFVAGGYQKGVGVRLTQTELDDIAAYLLSTPVIPDATNTASIRVGGTGAFNQRDDTIYIGTEQFSIGVDNFRYDGNRLKIGSSFDYNKTTDKLIAGGWTAEPTSFSSANEDIVLDTDGIITVGPVPGSQVTLESSAGTSTSTYDMLAGFEGFWLANEGDESSLKNLGDAGSTMDATVTGLVRVDGPAVWTPESSTQDNLLLATDVTARPDAGAPDLEVIFYGKAENFTNEGYWFGFGAWASPFSIYSQSGVLLYCLATEASGGSTVHYRNTGYTPPVNVYLWYKLSRDDSTGTTSLSTSEDGVTWTLRGSDIQDVGSSIDLTLTPVDTVAVGKPRVSTNPNPFPGAFKYMACYTAGTKFFEFDAEADLTGLGPEATTITSTSGHSLAVRRAGSGLGPVTTIVPRNQTVYVNPENSVPGNQIEVAGPHTVADGEDAVAIFYGSIHNEIGVGAGGGAAFTRVFGHLDDANGGFSIHYNGAQANEGPYGRFRDSAGSSLTTTVPVDPVPADPDYQDYVFIVIYDDSAETVEIRAYDASGGFTSVTSAVSSRIGITTTGELVSLRSLPGYVKALAWEIGVGSAITSTEADEIASYLFSSPVVPDVTRTASIRVGGTGTFNTDNDTIYMGRNQFSIGKDGFRWDGTEFIIGDDKLVFNESTGDLSITGEVSATTGDIGGWIINPTTIDSSSGRIKLDNDNTRIRVGVGGAGEVTLWSTGTIAGQSGLYSGATAYKAGTGFWLDSAGNFQVGNAGGNHIYFDTTDGLVIDADNFDLTAAGDVIITGTVTANAGAIGSINIGAGLTGGGSATGMYVGVGDFDHANTPFYVDSAGYFSLEDQLSWDGSELNISGDAVIQGDAIVNGTITTTKLSVLNQGDNLILNGDFGYPAARDETWLYAEGAATESFRAITTVDGINELTISGTSNTAWGSRPIPLVPGEKYIITYDLIGDSAFTYYARWNYKDVFATSITIGNRTGFSTGVDLMEPSGEVQTAPTSWTSFQHTWVAPASAKWGSLAFYNWNGASADALRIRNVKVVRQQEAVVIKDGTITADQIEANTITGNELNANTSITIGSNVTNQIHLVGDGTLAGTKIYSGINNGTANNGGFYFDAEGDATLGGINWVQSTQILTIGSKFDYNVGTNTLTIDGGAITTGTIQTERLETVTLATDLFSTTAIQSDDFVWDTITRYSTDGTQLNLADGNIIGENFRLDQGGQLFVQNIVAETGYIGNDTNGWSIGSTTISSSSIDAVVLNAADDKISIGTGSSRIGLDYSATPDQNKMYIGNGDYDSVGTPFYADGSGRLSVGNKLTFDGDDSALTVGAGDVAIEMRGTDNESHTEILIADQEDYFFSFDGNSANYLSLTAPTDPSTNDSVEMIAQVQLDTYGTTEQVIFSCMNSANGSGGWELLIDSSGNLKAQIDNGTSIHSATVSPTLVNGQTYWFKVGIELNSGGTYFDAHFYYHAGQGTEPTENEWDYLGKVITMVATAIGAPVNNLKIGRRSAGTASPMTGRLYNIIIRDGINSGGELIYDGTTFSTVPDSASLDFADAFAGVAHIRPDDWTPVAEETIMSKWTETGDHRSWAFSLLPSGELSFYLSTLGTAATIYTGMTSVGFANPAWQTDDLWVGFSYTPLDTINGLSYRKFIFFWSIDGITWNVVGESYTTPHSLVAYSSNTSTLNIGGMNGVYKSDFSGKILSYEIYDGAPTDVSPRGGTLVSQMLATDIPANSAATSFTITSGETLTVSGATIVPRKETVFETGRADRPA